MFNKIEITPAMKEAGFFYYGYHKGSPKVGLVTSNGSISTIVKDYENDNPTHGKVTYSIFTNCFNHGDRRLCTTKDRKVAVWEAMNWFLPPRNKEWLKDPDLPNEG